MLDENRAAAGGVRAIDISPAVTNEKTALQIDRVFGCGVEQHAGLRFPAVARIAMFAPGVVTDFNRVQGRHGGAQFRVHRFDRFPGLGSSTDIRLIGHHNQNKARLFKLRASFRGLGINVELLDPRRRKRKSVTHHRPIENAIPIEKDGPSLYFVLSHFVCAVFSAG